MSPLNLDEVWLVNWFLVMTLGLEQRIREPL